MNSIDYSNNLFTAIDIIVDKKLKEAKFDRTIRCRVIGPNDLYATSYKVEYQG